MPSKYFDIHFEILGVTRSSTNEEIKKAYKLQIKLWHPDKFANAPEKIFEAEERSKKINEAWTILENYQPPTYSHKPPNENYRKQPDPSSFTKAAHGKATRINIERITVKSSNIHSVGYNSLYRILQVQFHHGGIYQYYDVPGNVYTEFMQASSKGKFLNAKIVCRYRCESV